MRTAQARIARAVAIPPESISPAKLFPRVAAASSTLNWMKIGFKRTQEWNRHVRLKEPDRSERPEHRVSLESILVEPRKGPRRKRRYCAARRRAVSLHHFTRGRPRKNLTAMPLEFGVHVDGVAARLATEVASRAAREAPRHLAYTGQASVALDDLEHAREFMNRR